MHKLPSSLLQAVKHGGRAEYDAVTSAVTASKTPTIQVAAMCAMGAAQDTSFLEETWQYMMTKSRDQDIPYYFMGLAANANARHFLLRKFRQDYRIVRDLFARQAAC